MSISIQLLKKSIKENINICGNENITNNLSSFTCNSKDVINDSIFFAISKNAHNYIDDAINLGAKVIVYFENIAILNNSISYIKCNDVATAYSNLCREYYSRVDEKLQLLGVTGTNGKTTTVYIWQHLMNCGLISTIDYFDGKKRVPATHTTPDALTLFNLFTQMHENSLKSVAMELSSHALSQNRCGDIKFKVAVFTNLTGDHLDYHGTMENCYQAKKQLFSKMLSQNGVAIINIDDKYGERLYSEIKDNVKTITFGENCNANCQIDFNENFTLKFNNNIYKFSTNLIGKHNIMNLTGAILGAFYCGMSYEEIKDKISQNISIPGRLQSLKLPNGAEAFVDYAHTDDALKNVLSILKKISKGNIICVFGAGGNRDKSKRPRMAHEVAKFANIAIVTSDNPRDEEPEEIISEISKGFPQDFNYIIEVDRKAAIKRAIELSKANDIILIAGKGHEKTQEIKGKKFTFDDYEVICKYC